jgi:hypothetical protein
VPTALYREASSVLIHGRTCHRACRLTAAVCAPSMPLSWVGCPQPVRWLLMCTVASALGGLLGERCLRMAGYVRGWRRPGSARRRRGLVLPTL